MWQKTGGDCGICMSACPFSQGVEENLINNMKDNPQIMDKIIEDHKAKYSKRNYLKKFP